MDSERANDGGMADLIFDAPGAARAAELRYVQDDEPGFSRRRHARHWRYLDAGGARIADESVIRRVASLAIPPAWTSVWICGSDDGHIQATGRDARGRKQYRYHSRWRAVRDEAKYEHILTFGAALPALRERIAKDLASPSLSRDKVVATVLRVMERTHIRVGNDCYAAENGSFGLTTLLDRHAKFEGHSVSFAFQGKSRKVHRISLRDAKLAAIVKRCRDVPGQRLFQWLDEQGAPHAVTSNDVNNYIREATGGPFTAKMLRTWSATALAFELLYQSAPCSSGHQAKRAITACLETISEQLGNTPAICRKSYVHPAVVTSYADGTLHPVMRRCLATARRRTRPGLSVEEAAVLVFFERRTEVPLRVAA